MLIEPAMLSLFRRLPLALALAVGAAKAQDPNDRGPSAPGGFDFYVLSLTWVPGYCAGHSDPVECSLPTGFALHGLWPESRNGYPSFCGTEPLPDDARTADAGLFASPTLVEHEWQKHGTCTGLGVAGYFDKTRAALQKVAVPAAYRRAEPLSPADAETIKTDFLAANPGMMRDSLTLLCQEGHIAELHVCLDKDGAFRACEAWEKAEDNCR